MRNVNHSEMQFLFVAAAGRKSPLMRIADSSWTSPHPKSADIVAKVFGVSKGLTVHEILGLFDF